MKNQQPLVAIMGVDGSGKSSVMEIIQKQFKENGKEPVYILPRSKYKPPAKKREKNSISPSHHALPAYAPVISIFKLFYKGLQWVISYYTQVAALRKNGTLVLGDHFYFYYLAIDPLRFRYGGPVELVWKAIGWLPKPDINILLKVDAEVANKRKQELTPDALNRLIKAHDELMNNMPNGYVVDANRPLSEVVREVTKLIERYSNVQGE